MSKTERLNSPAELVAIARAAHVVGDSELKRAAVGALVARFGIKIQFPKPELVKTVIDGREPGVDNCSASQATAVNDEWATGWWLTNHRASP